LGRFGFTATTIPAGTRSGNIKLKGLNLDVVGILSADSRNPRSAPPDAPSGFCANVDMNGLILTCASAQRNVANWRKVACRVITHKGKPPAMPGDSPGFDLYDGRCESPSLDQETGEHSERISESESYEVGL